MPLDHTAFRWEVIKVVDTLYPNPHPPKSVYQAIQAVSLRESSYALGWKAPGKGSNNTGAVQSKSCDPSVAFEYVDTHPNPDGTSTEYHVCFKKYPSIYSGLRDQTQIMFRNPKTLDAAWRGDLWGVSAGMFESHYYEGFGATKEIRINNHYKALKSAVETIAKALNEPIAFKEQSSIPSKNPMTNATNKDSAKTLGAVFMAVSIIRWLK